MNTSRSMGIQLFIHNNLYMWIHVDSELYRSKYVLITLSVILLSFPTVWLYFSVLIVFWSVEVFCPNVINFPSFIPDKETLNNGLIVYNFKQLLIIKFGDLLYMY